MPLVPFKSPEELAALKKVRSFAAPRATPQPAKRTPTFYLGRNVEPSDPEPSAFDMESLLSGVGETQRQKNAPVVGPEMPTGLRERVGRQWTPPAPTAPQPFASPEDYGVEAALGGVTGQAKSDRAAAVSPGNLFQRGVGPRTGAEAANLRLGRQRTTEAFATIRERKADPIQTPLDVIGAPGDLMAEIMLQDSEGKDWQSKNATQLLQSYRKRPMAEQVIYSSIFDVTNLVPALGPFDDVARAAGRLAKFRPLMEDLAENTAKSAATVARRSAIQAAKTDWRAVQAARAIPPLAQAAQGAGRLARQVAADETGSMKLPDWGKPAEAASKLARKLGFNDDLEKQVAQQFGERGQRFAQRQQEMAPTVDRLATAIRQAKRIPGKIEAERTVERSRRVAVAAKILEAGTGREAFESSTAALGGKLPTQQFDKVEGAFTPEDITGLFEIVKDAPLPYFQRLNASVGLQRMLTGEVPRRFEIDLLEKIFGKKLADAILSKRSFGQKAWDEFLAAINIPRAISTAYDLSAPMRQGIALGVGHPVQFGGNIVPMLKAWKRKAYADAVETALLNRPLYGLGEQSGLFLATRGGDITTREEAYVSKWVSKIWGMNMSERAYVTFLNKLRADVFDKVARDWMKAGITFADDPKRFQQLADWINITTGRGKLGPLSRYAPLMSATFFSPRFAVSRFELLAQPALVLAKSPAMRKVIAKDLLAFAGTGVMALSLLSLSGVGSVGLDPRTADFGKIRIGNTRLDFWGGMQQVARVVANLTAASLKSVGAPLPGARADDPNVAEVIGQFLRSKLSPPAGFATDVVMGETYLGDEVTASKETVGSQAWNRLTPMMIQDIVEGYQEEGVTGGFLGALSGTGVGVATYQSRQEQEEEVARRMLETGELPPELRNLSERDLLTQPQVQDEVVSELGRKERRGKPPSAREQTEVAVLQWDRQRQASDAQLAVSIKALNGKAGEPLRKAIQEYKSTRFKASQAIFTEDARAVLTKDNPTTLELLRERYWGADAPTDPATGEPDFQAREAAQAAVVEEAAGLGIAEELVKSRPRRSDNPEIEVLLREYEADQEKLRPYWEIADKIVAGRSPSLRRAYKATRGQSAETVAKRDALPPGLRSALTDLEQEISQRRASARRRKPALDMALIKWGYAGEAKSSRGRLQTIRESREPALAR